MLNSIQLFWLQRVKKSELQPLLTFCPFSAENDKLSVNVLSAAFYSCFGNNCPDQDHGEKVCEEKEPGMNDLFDPTLGIIGAQLNHKVCCFIHNTTNDAN